MIKEIDILNKENTEHILSIQLDSYFVEAKIIGLYDLPPLRDTIESLQQSGERFFGYYMDETLCGVVSIKIEKEEIDIHRLFVHPNYFRKGIAQGLLDFLETNFSAKTMKVATGSKNHPAVKFYLKNKFQRINEMVVDNQISLSFFKKEFRV
ncbi:GNAT family N-acetyltransferase [Paucisalibacillus sp. EB02]|uniref:GNAT family N-acetyltransferase n=1 Tax=Paucisalibacillus sp. EB02 TaxID=1347087 RepID=UPI0005AADDE4|nr:GNAT family N-acetyltransferase [Paucisalibacillus sp. EB02]